MICLHEKSLHKSVPTSHRWLSIGCPDGALWEKAKAARREARLRENAVISYAKDQQLKARSRRHTRSRNQS